MFAEDYKINEQQKIIENEMIQNNEIIDFELYDSMAALADLIKNSDVKESEEIIKKYSNYINSELIEYMYDNKKIFFEFNYMLDVLKHKINAYEKDTEERLILKEIQKKLKDIYNCYKETDKKEESPYFGIVKYWLKDENNYLNIKELLARKKIYNIYGYENGNYVHIIKYILDQYISNFKQMIKDKDSNYINKNYFKEVYYLFTKNYKIKLTDEEKEEIDNTLNEFTTYIKETLIKEKRINAALKEIKSMKTINYYEKFINYDFAHYSEDSLGYESQRINNFLQSEAKSSLATPTFLLGNKAYRISKKSNGTILRMYTLDSAKYVAEAAISYQHLEKCNYNKEKPYELLIKNLEFKENKKYPVISYVLEFAQNGMLKNLSIEHDVIYIDKKYSTIYEMDDTLKDMYSLYKKSVSKINDRITDYDIYQINKHFNKILNNGYIELVHNYRMPVIYYGYNIKKEEEIDRQITDLSNNLSKLDKKDSRDVENIIKSNIDIPHYSIIYEKDAVYDFELTEFSFLGINNQKIISDIYFNQRQYSSDRMPKLREEYLYRNYKIVQELNQYQHYVETAEIKESRGKIKRKLHI